jgi:hypothetical protein
MLAALDPGDSQIRNLLSDLESAKPISNASPDRNSAKFKRTACGVMASASRTQPAGIGD